jgi:uncharacterized protein YndB with AHSA1/START domain
MALASLVFCLIAQNAAAPTKSIVKEVVLPLPIEQAWALWADSKGATSYGIPQVANIELFPGGKYEIFFNKDAPEGERGSEGCNVLSVNPYHMISFTWNAPPTLAELRKADVRTQVNVFFEKSPYGTRVRLVQHGLGVGKEWDKYHEYFDKAWGLVLSVQKDWASKQPKVAPTSAADFQSL